MPSRRLLALALLTALAAVLLFVSLPDRRNRQPGTSSRPDSSQLAESSLSKAQVPQKISTQIASSEHSAPIAPAPAERPAIEGERILTFANDSELQAFLKTLSQDDFTIVSVNNTLRSARLRARNPNAIAKLPLDSDYNYTTLLPLPVDPSLLGGTVPFADTGLSFMNASLNDTEAGEGITIAILDTGIRDHDTLSEAEIEHIDFSEAESSRDYFPHGTAVASLIAGKDGSGIAPGARLMSVRVLDTEGLGDTFTLAEGIVQAVDAGADIINMSLGSYGTNQALANAIAYADSKGVALVASAGNEAVTALPFPASYPSVIAVTAIDANGDATSFANQSPSIDIAAPGVGVYAAWNDQDWTSFTGTSAAAPYVAGGIAAVSSQLNVSVKDAVNIILENANDLGPPGPDPQHGLGHLDLRRSLDSRLEYTDLALADLHLETIPNDYGQHTLAISIQNRGTEAIPAASVRYTLANDIPQTILLGHLAPGQSAAHILTLPESELSKAAGYPINARVEIESGQVDQRSENDEQTKGIRLPAETEVQP